MKALVEGFMSRQPVPYVLFGAGAMVAVIMEMLEVPALIVALGMYLPLELNSPALVGGVISHYVTKRSERLGGGPGRTMRERAVIIASGLMAGGALGGVFGASLRLFGWYREDLIKLPFFDNEPVSQLVSSAGFLLLLRADTYPLILLATGFFIFSKTLLRPSILSLVSKNTGMGQGAALGLSNSFMSLGRIAGPLWAGYAFDVNMDYPYLSGAAILFLGFLLSLAWWLRMQEKTNGGEPLP